MQADLIITNAMLLDGSGSDATAGHLAIRDGVIVAMGDFPVPAGVVVLDAAGHALAPGFIDSHTHDDGYLLVHPDMTPKVSQGITTVVTGNCGISLAPLVADEIVQPLDLLGPPELFRYSGFADWLRDLSERPAAVNVIPLIGHTTLRAAVMQDLTQAANKAECAAMSELVEAAMQAGAFGVSTGTFYPPASAATTQEIIDVCTPLRGRHGIYATHLRDESDQIDAAIEEALAIGAATQSRVVFSHHKLAGEQNHGRSSETLARITEASRDQPVCLDCHPYPATSTMLRLDRVKLASRTMVTWSRSVPEAAGRDFKELMEEFGLDVEQTLQKLTPAGAIYFLMAQEDVDRIIKHPLTMIGSDGLPFDPHPHPRQWGTFTQVLRRLVRESKLLALPEAIHKMTGLAAAQYGLSDRGLLQVGQRADLVLFDPATVADRATFSEPIQTSLGVTGVWVNGERVWDGDRPTGARPGQVLRPAHQQA